MNYHTTLQWQTLETNSFKVIYFVFSYASRVFMNCKIISLSFGDILKIILFWRKNNHAVSASSCTSFKNLSIFFDFDESHVTLQLWVQQSSYQPHCSVVNARLLKQESKIGKK